MILNDAEIDVLETELLMSAMMMSPSPKSWMLMPTTKDQC
jgi:hypothetical protein